MANLHDVVTLVKPKSTSKFEKMFDSVIDEANVAADFLRKIGADTNDMRKKTQAVIEKIRIDSFNETCSIPKALSLVPDVTGTPTTGMRTVEAYRSPGSYYRDDADAYSMLSARPLSTTSKLRFITDTLGMAIIPFGALDSRSLAHEDYNVRAAVKSFSSQASQVGMDLYVIVPLELYDVLAHVNMDDHSLSMPYSKDHATTLQTIGLQLPMFRAMNSAINNLDSRVGALEATQTIIKTQLVNLQNQMTTLQEDVGRLRKEAYIAKIKAEEASAAAIKVIESRAATQWFATDPLIFAVRRGDKITDDAVAIIGPCWGPDFSDILLIASGLNVVSGQRKKLSN
jgi:hypothetical protein